MLAGDLNPQLGTMPRPNDNDQQTLSEINVATVQNPFIIEPNYALSSSKGDFYIYLISILMPEL